MAERFAQFEQAIDLALQGFAVFPLKPGTKKPLFKNWEKQASTDPHQIARWWTANPRANIAIACGPSNLIVIDLDAAKRPDGPSHGQHVLNAFAAGREIPRTFTIASARGGRHLYFRQPDGAALRSTVGSDTSGLGPLIDTRGHGGFIVAPGSVFEGRTYSVEHDASVAQLPPWIASELATRPPTEQPIPEPAPSRKPITGRRRAAYGDAAVQRSADTVATAPEGTRNDTLNREAFRLGRLIGGGVLHHDDVARALGRAARKAGLPPGEVESTIASGLTAGISHPRSIPDRTPDPLTESLTTEASMTSLTTQPSRPADQSIAEPPSAGDLYSRLSAPGSRAFQDALRALWRLGPTAIGLPEANAEPVRAAWQQAGQQMAAAIHEHETVKPPDADIDPALVETKTAPAADAAPTQPPPDTAAHEESETGPEPDFDFEDIWTDVRSSIERARQALPDWSELNTTDDLKPAIDEVLRYLAQAPVPRGIAVRVDDTTAPKNPSVAATDPEDSTDDVDEYLLAVDTAYADAQAAGLPSDLPEWAGITAIHSAIHNLWDTIKAATGTYWAELSADARVRGLLTTLATRSARAIASLANAAADRLDQRAEPQQSGAEAVVPGLREAYINARNHVRAHAASHEWQRITALWGTVNTLARQTDDPGIRAVVARSADAISDYSDTLGRKTSQYGDADAAGALKTLAVAAERHASSLRASELGHGQHAEQERATTVLSPGRLLDDSSHAQRNLELQALQARARQVAQHAQARLGQTGSKPATIPRRTRAVGGRQAPDALMRPQRPSVPSESVKMQAQ